MVEGINLVENKPGRLVRAGRYIGKRITKPTLKQITPQTLTKPERKGFKGLRKIQPTPRLSQEQGMLREMFGGNGEQLWGTGQNLPQLNGALTSGRGLVNSGDEERETASLFGL